ncbi:substrate-binding domain-containing protein [Anaeromyxobacter diazotrophicus]|uniref:PBP domain-containing protein n=1 Tax=Anaeromyxobacter diazotrophicus TaxID=2590199 RepID=A0A7I9VI28_9BACT|nr:substrate-binding domain-containing protein [Anaeromyxobacter diazotrophicus]GEJ55770.1 hypothetical protein AMYX_05110 [Anaeromyxobacter diazotrophicus]
MTSWKLGLTATLLAAAAGAAPAPAVAGDVIRVNGSGSALDMLKPLVLAYAASHRLERFQLDPPLGSSGAMKALLGGALDVAALSRAVLPQEAAGGVRALAYGRTPLVIVTHREVARSSVDSAELERIYSGATPTWPGGEPIRVVLRPMAETKTAVLRGLSPGMARADDIARARPWAIVAVTDPESNELVARTPGAIGAATLTSILVEGLPLRPLALDGVPGTVEALAQGRYRLATDITLVTSARSSPEALAFVEFACSAEGRALARKSGVLTEAGGCGELR